MKNVPEKRHFPYVKTIIIFIFIILFVICSVLYLYPVKYSEIISKYSKKYNLPEELIYAVINTESGFDKNEVSPKGAKGLMQIMENTADWVNSKETIENYDYNKIFDPELNIHIGCWYLSWLKETYKDHTLILAAYNAGSGNISKWLSDEKYSKDGKTLSEIPFKETRDYVKKVNSSMTFYKYILKFPFIN
ncbi:MAG: lytic transglycosylase domain-containing protein [Clostridiales bacterium]|nr:lytic transglycosylase domain-containing protein [Clostridiales bacterium]